RISVRSGSLFHARQSSAWFSFSCIDHRGIFGRTTIRVGDHRRVPRADPLSQHAETALCSEHGFGGTQERPPITLHTPFNRPCLSGNEYKYIAEATANGHASGDGPFTRRCHDLLEQELQVPKVLLTTSCTHALELAALLLDLAPGDEVVLPSFTFVSTA